MTNKLMTESRLDGTHLILGIGASCLAAAVALWFDNALALGCSVSLMLTLTVALGALREGSVGPFRYWLVAALAVWLAAFALMLWLPATTEVLIFGLPPATAVSVLVLWPAPLLLVTLPYALHFDSHILSETFRQHLHTEDAAEDGQGGS